MHRKVLRTREKAMQMLTLMVAGGARRRVCGDVKISDGESCIVPMRYPRHIVKRPRIVTLQGRGTDVTLPRRRWMIEDE